MFISVYAPQGVNCKRVLWNQLSDLIGSISGDCIVIGDFNIVRDDTKRLGSHYHPTVAINFNDFIDFRDTNDVPMGVLILLGVTSRGLNLVNLIDFWSPRVL